MDNEISSLPIRHFTEAELTHMERDPLALRLAANYHHARAAEASGIGEPGVSKGSQELHLKEAKELDELADDLEKMYAGMVCKIFATTVLMKKVHEHIDYVHTLGITPSPDEESARMSAINRARVDHPDLVMNPMEQAQQAQAKKATKQEIMDLIKLKRKDKLAGKTEEELTAMLESL